MIPKKNAFYFQGWTSFVSIIIFTRSVQWMQSDMIVKDTFLPYTFSWKSYQNWIETFCCRWAGFQTIVMYKFTAIHCLLKPRTSVIVQHLCGGKISGINWHYLFIKNWRLHFPVIHECLRFWRKRYHIIQEMFYLLDTRITVDHHVKLVSILLVGHWSNSTLAFWGKCWLVIFLYYMASFSRINGALNFWNNIESFKHAFCNESSSFKNCWWEADCFLLCLKNFHLLSFHFSMLFLIFAGFFAITNFAYNE